MDTSAILLICFVLVALGIVAIAVVSSDDPIPRNLNAPRPFFLRQYIRYKDWQESRDGFGQGPTAGWATFTEILSWPYRKNTIFLGTPKVPHHIGSMRRPVGIDTKKHMITIGATGSGKSSGAMIPNLCLHQGSLLCIDPKGELAQITATRRGSGGNGVKGLGQSVYVLDPYSIVHGQSGAAYNPLDELIRISEKDPEDAVSYAGRIADALVVVSDAEQPFFDNSSKTFISGLVLYVLMKPSAERNLNHLRKLLLEGEPLPPEGRESGGPFDNLMQHMQLCPEGPYSESIAGAARFMCSMEAVQFGGTITTAQEHTRFLDLPKMKRVLTHSDFLLADLVKNKTSVYVCLPSTLVEGKEGRWLRMIVLLFVDMMMLTEKAPDDPILFAIDEFPALGHLQDIERAAPQLRSRGVRFWAIGQDIGQFRNAYPRTWEGFIGNAAAVQFMSLTHPETVRYLCDLLGTHIVLHDDPSDLSTEKEKRRKIRVEEPLLTPDQASRILEISRHNQIIWRGDHRPMMLRIRPYFSYLPFRYYEPDVNYEESASRRKARSRAVEQDRQTRTP